MMTFRKQEKSISDASEIIWTLRVQIKVIRDNSPLGAHEIPVDYLDDLKACLIELKKNTLDFDTHNLYLGLLGEFALSRWLEVRGFTFDHRTRSNPSELLTDFLVEDLTQDHNKVNVDVKTSGIRPAQVSRLLSLEQYESIPTHSDILVWTFYSDWRSSVTIDSWTPVSLLDECKLKSVSAPPDFVTTNDPSVDMDFTETMFVYEVPPFLMFDIDDLEMKLSGYGGGVQSILR
jgi:hypothetical protein